MKNVLCNIILFIFVLTGVAACATSPQVPQSNGSLPAESVDSQAQTAYSAENWPETARLYGMLVDQSPSNARYWYRLAVAQRYLGNHDLALASLDSGVANGLPVFYADYERAKVAATLGNRAQAITLLKSAAAAGLSGKGRVLENEQLAALRGTEGFNEVMEQLDINAHPCRDEVFHQFDFWLGTWEVTTANGAVAGRNTISARENDCLLLEEWSSATGGSGTSMNYYDAISREWTQVWISPGLQLRISGGMDAGSMILTGSAHYIQQGTTSPFRGTWTPLEDGRVRQFFEQQGNDGNWTTWFEGFYTKVPATVGSED